MKEYKIKINGNDYNVAIDEAEGNTAKVEVNGTPFSVEFERPIAKPKAVSQVKRPAPAAAAPVAAPVAKPAAVSAAGGNVISSPLPGVVLSINKQVGDAVKKGETVLVLEAMKMENAIEATCDGTIKEIKVQKGDSVLEGAALIVIG